MFLAVIHHVAIFSIVTGDHYFRSVRKHLLHFQAKLNKFSILFGDDCGLFIDIDGDLEQAAQVAFLLVYFKVLMELNE